MLRDFSLGLIFRSRIRACQGQNPILKNRFCFRNGDFVFTKNKSAPELFFLIPAEETQAQQRRDSDERPRQGVSRLHKVESRERGDAEDHQDLGTRKRHIESDPLQQEQQGRGGGGQKGETEAGRTQEQEGIEERKVIIYFLFLLRPLF